LAFGQIPLSHGGERGDCASPLAVERPAEAKPRPGEGGLGVIPVQAGIQKVKLLKL